jgi:phenylpropionate dioxygenase-like ring-hydroxylating dioxygenase large terminal subunit
MTSERLHCRCVFATSRSSFFAIMPGSLRLSRTRAAIAHCRFSAGTVVDDGLRCGYHGLTFARDGSCIRIPGQDHIPAKARVRCYPAIERDAMIWIWMGDPALANPDEIVTYPYHADPANWPHKHATYEIAASAMLVIDNLMDLTHLGFVHASTIGGNPSAHVNAIMNVTPLETGLSYTRWMLDCATPPTHKMAVPTLGASVDRWQEFEYIAPGCIRQWSGSLTAGTGAYTEGKRGGGFSIRLFHAITPQTENTCLYFWSTAIGYRQNEPSVVTASFNDVAKAFQEDKAILELQQIRIAETAPERLVNIANDGARIQMRRVVERMLQNEPGLSPREMLFTRS